MSAERAVIDAERSDYDQFLAALQALGTKIKGRSVSCPQHDDQTPSASILEEPGSGVWRVFCHVCGGKGWDLFDLRAMTGRPVSEQLKAIAPEPERRIIKGPAKPEPVRYPTMEALIAAVRNPEAVYRYTDEAGAVCMVVFRLIGQDGKKKFIQAAPFGDHWRMNAPDGLLPLYCRDAIAKATEVFVVEGEKCAHALMAAGHTATTSPGGAGKAALADWRPLAGKVVYLWPDNDPPDPKRDGARTGLDHMRDVAAQLQDVHPAPRVYWIDPDTLDLPPKGDVADLLEGMPGADLATRKNVIRDIMLDAEPMGASVGVGRVIEDTIAGRRRALPWKWPRVGLLTKAMLPGTVTLLCGEPGSSKSFFLLEAMAYWHGEGVRCALFELEDDRDFHLYRALAQRSRDSRLFDDSWVEANPAYVRAAYQEHAWFLDGFGRCIWEAPEKQITLEGLADWVTGRARAGCRVIGIDPITAAVPTDKPWVSDLKFIMAAKTAVREYGSSLIIVTHPTKTTQKKPGMSGMSGGAAYQRFAHTALWLEFMEESQAVTVFSSAGAAEIECNRILSVIKARNGKGNGARLAYDFNGASLCFNELGSVAKADTKPPQETTTRAHHRGPPSDKENLFDV